MSGETYTIDEILAWGTCGAYKRERLEELFDGRDSLTAAEILYHPDVSASDRIWWGCHLLPPDRAAQFARWCVARARAAARAAEAAEAEAVWTAEAAEVEAASAAEAETEAAAVLAMEATAALAARAAAVAERSMQLSKIKQLITDGE